jgi:hypothetical protein
MSLTENALLRNGVLGPGLRRDDVNKGQPASVPPSVIPLKSGTHASLHLRSYDRGRS